MATKTIGEWIEEAESLGALSTKTRNRSDQLYAQAEKIRLALRASLQGVGEGGVMVTRPNGSREIAFVHKECVYFAKATPGVASQHLTIPEIPSAEPGPELGDAGGTEDGNG